MLSYPNRQSQAISHTHQRYLHISHEYSAITKLSKPPPKKKQPKKNHCRKAVDEHRWRDKRPFPLLYDRSEDSEIYFQRRLGQWENIFTGAASSRREATGGQFVRGKWELTAKDESRQDEGRAGCASGPHLCLSALPESEREKYYFLVGQMAMAWTRDASKPEVLPKAKWARHRWKTKLGDTGSPSLSTGFVLIRVRGETEPL